VAAILPIFTQGRGVSAAVWMIQRWILALNGRCVVLFWAQMRYLGRPASVGRFIVLEPACWLEQMLSGGGYWGRWAACTGSG
jgi:hypothetical protein